jgi:hypothetical protein
MSKHNNASQDEDKYLAASSLIDLLTGGENRVSFSTSSGALSSGVSMEEKEDDFFNARKIVTSTVEEAPDRRGDHPKKHLRMVECNSTNDDSSYLKKEDTPKRFKRRSSVVIPNKKVIDNVPSSSPRRYSCPEYTSSNRRSSFKSCTSKIKTMSEDFSYLLMTVLTSSVYNETLYFLPDNKTFIVVYNQRLLEEIMPNIFNITRFGDFLNAIGKLGFKHLRVKDSRHMFCHPSFRKDDWASLQGIKDPHAAVTSSKRTTVSSTLSRKRKTSNSRLEITPKKKTQKTRQALSDMLILSRPPTHLIPSPSSTLCDPILLPFTNIPSNYVNDVTKNVVANAIDCLLRDEKHTFSMARQGGHQSMPCFQTPY